MLKQPRRKASGTETGVAARWSVSPGTSSSELYGLYPTRLTLPLVVSNIRFLCSVVKCFVDVLDVVSCHIVSHSEKGGTDKLLAGLRQEVDSRHAELEVLRGSSLELQRERDLLRRQREDLETQLARRRTEVQRGYKHERMTITQRTWPP